jgi:hypothetical protein
LLAILLAVPLVVLALLLFTPLHFDIAFESRTGGRRQFFFRWLFGLVRAELGAERAPSGAPPERTRKPRKRRKRGRRRAHVLAMLQSRGFVSSVLRLLIRLARAFRFHRLFARLRAGCDDPADTGLLCAWILPPAAWIETQRPGTIEVIPDFTGEALDVALEAEISVTPARLLAPVVLFGLSPRTLLGLVALRTGRAW